MRHFLAFWLLLALTPALPLAGASTEVVLSELLILNSRSLPDEDGEFPGWVELYNPGVSPIAMQGWRLSDDPANPSRWVFPQATLPPGGYLVVFLSGKNRANNNQPMHTNFQLPPENGYLALHRPDGSLATSISGYPRQAVDISYGPPMRLENNVRVGEGAAGRVHVPANDTLGLNWIQEAFNDSSWTQVSNGIGYERDPAPSPAAVLADSEADFSGVQGFKNWYYGYYDRTLDLDLTYQTNNLTLFPANYFDGTAWDWTSAPQAPWTYVGPREVHPNGLNNITTSFPNSNEHWVFKRWRSSASGPLRVHFHYYKSNPGCGDGVAGLVFRNGSLVYSNAIPIADRQGKRLVFDFVNVQADDLFDFAISPIGPGAIRSSDECDGSAFHVRIETGASLHGHFQSNVETLMYNINPGIYYRVPFTIPSGSTVGKLRLRMKHDDGFIAYLNGTEILRKLAPVEGPGGRVANSSAEFSGVQGQNNWYYGYYNRTQDPDQIYQPGDFVLFPHAGGAYSPTHFYDGAKWDWFNGNPPWTELTSTGGHPNGDNNGNEHWVIRRWRSEVAGTLSIQYVCEKSNKVCGNGVRCAVAHNGRIVAETVIPFNSAAVTNTFNLPGVDVGDAIDFILSPEGTDGWRSDGCDGSIFYAVIDHVAAPGTTWNSASVAAHPDHQARQFLEFDLQAAAPLLRTGNNLLAFHGLNAAANDSDFLLVPRLEDERVVIETGSDYLLPTPRGLNLRADFRFPRITQLLLSPGGRSITWESSAQKRYRLEYADELPADIWSPVEQVTASGATTTLEDASSIPGEARFYRVVLLFPESAPDEAEETPPNE